MRLSPFIGMRLIRSGTVSAFANILVESMLCSTLMMSKIFLFEGAPHHLYENSRSSLFVAQTQSLVPFLMGSISWDGRLHAQFGIGGSPEFTDSIQTELVQQGGRRERLGP